MDQPPLEDRSPGTYSVVVAAASGSLTSSSTITFELLSTAVSGEGLEGAITVDPAQVIPGAVATAEYRIDNHGNSAVNGMPARITLTSEDDEQVYDEESFTLSVGKGATDEGQLELDTMQPEGAYAVLLQVEIDGQYRTIAWTRLSLLSLAGTISASPSTVEGGEENVTLDFSVTNLSEVLLENLEVRVEVIALDSGVTVFDLPDRRRGLRLRRRGRLCHAPA